MVVPAMVLRCAMVAATEHPVDVEDSKTTSLMGRTTENVEDSETTSLMETAPWRVARRWAATAASSADRPAMVTHSARSFPTASRRTGHDDRTRDGGQAAAPDTGDADFLTEDIANFEQIPPTPTQRACRLLWAGLLEIQDEEAMREDTADALSQDAVAVPERGRLAARHLCRIRRRLLHGRSATGLLLAMALPNLLSRVQEAVD